MSDDTHTLHAHEPDGPIAPFAHTCKHCGELIEAEHCKACDGIGLDCPTCKNTGVARWVLIL